MLASSPEGGGCDRSPKALIWRACWRHAKRAFRYSRRMGTLRENTFSFLRHCCPILRVMRHHVTSTLMLTHPSRSSAGMIRRSSGVGASASRPATLSLRITRPTGRRHNDHGALPGMRVRLSPPTEAHTMVSELLPVRRLLHRLGFYPVFVITARTLAGCQTAPVRRLPVSLVRSSFLPGPHRSARSPKRLAFSVGSPVDLHREVSIRLGYLMQPRDSVASRNCAVRHWDYYSGSLHRGQSESSSQLPQTVHTDIHMDGA